MKEDIDKLLLDVSKDDVRFCKDNYGKSVILINRPVVDEAVRSYGLIEIVDGTTSKVFGEVQYGFIYEGNSKYVWLHNIFVNRAEDLNRGVGFYGIKFLEEIAYSHRFDTIEGKYYPKEPATKEQVDKFYTRNGYSIEQDDYHKIIYKNLKKIEIDKIEKSKFVNSDGYYAYPSIRAMVAEPSQGQNM